MSAALEARGLSAGYGRLSVLRDIDLTVAAGSVTALLGPNGAGKTTLLRTLGGLLALTAGTVQVGGKDSTRATPAQRARHGLCLIPEGRGVFPALTVRENLRLQVPPWRRDASIDEALEIFPALSSQVDRRAGSLSGGQQQMVALSRCFLAKPSVVLLDEVSMGLAPRVVNEIFEALRALARSGVALLIVEQYVALALELADEVYLLQHGRMVHRGPTSELDHADLEARYFGAST